MKGRPHHITFSCRLLSPRSAYLLACILVMIFPLNLHPQEPDRIQEYITKAAAFKSKNQFDSAIVYFQKLEAIYAAKVVIKEKIDIQIEIVDILVNKREYINVPNELQNIENLLNTNHINDTRLLAKYFQVKGSYFLSIGQLDSSKLHLDKAIFLYSNEISENDSLFHYAWNKLGNYYFIAGNFPSALNCYEKAYNYASLKKNKNNELAASSLQNMGIASVKMGEYSLAEKYFLKSLSLNEKLFAITEPALSSIYLNLGKFYIDLSKYDLALKFFDLAEKVLSSNKVDQQLNSFITLYWNKGNLYTLKGEYEKSISYLLKAYSLIESNSDSQKRYVQAILMDIGFVYQKKNDLQNAIHYYIQSIPYQQTPSIVKSYRNLGVCYMQLDNTDSSRFYYRLAIKKAKGFSLIDSYDIALCYQYYGELLSKQNNDSALYYYHQALHILEELFNKNNRDISRIQLLIADYHLANRQPGKALKPITAALESLSPELLNFKEGDDLDPLKGYSDIILPAGLNLKARYYHALYLQDQVVENLESSLLYLKISSKAIGQIRETYDDEESQIILNNLARETIDLGVTVCFELYRRSGEHKYVEEAFSFSEQGKALILLSALRGLKAKSSAALPQTLTEKENLLSRELSFYNNLIYNESRKNTPDSSKISLWNEQVFSLRKSFDSLLILYRSAYPEYFRLKYDFTVAPIDTVINCLSPDQAMLAYHLTDSVAYGFIITKTVTVIRDIGHSAELINKLNSIRRMFDLQGPLHAGSEDFLNLATLSSELYDILIKPFENNLSGLRLVVIPDGVLGLLSFDILLKELPSQAQVNFKDLAYLILDHPLSYNSSATIFCAQQQQVPKKGKLKGALSFAPSYGMDYYHRGGGLTDSIFLNLSPIAGTVEEVNSIAKVYPSRVFTNESATEQKFKSLAGNYSILHLAMHTLIDHQKPLFSKLVFSPEPGDTLEDGYLNTYELFNLNLRGDLAVLSACNTGSGKVERGEGIISLARGFFYAGIPSVVMTLWEIEDHSSADLLPLFYANLKSGMPKDVALQQAKRQYLQNAGKLQSHPYFWAGFINYGQTSPVMLSNQFNLQNIWILSLPVIVILMLIYFFINRRVYFRKKRH